MSGLADVVRKTRPLNVDDNGNLDLSNSYLTVKEPIKPNEVANKKYVDEAVAGGGGESKGIIAGSSKISVIERLTDYTIDVTAEVVDTTTAQILSNKIFRAQDGIETFPSHSFVNSNSSGMWYDPATLAVKLSASGVNQLSVSASGVDGAVQVRGSGGNATNPSLSFTNKQNSGIHNQGNTLLVVANGTTSLEISDSAVNAPSGIQFTSRNNGANVSPDYSFDQNQNMGMFRNGNNEMGFSVVAQTKMLLTGSLIKPFVPIETFLGSPGAPVIHSTGASDSGIYFNAGGQVAVSESGQQKILFTGTETLHLQKNRYPDGSAASPSVAFGPSGVDGLYWAAGAVNTLYMTFGTGSAFYNQNEVGVGANARFRPGTDGIMDLGNSNRRWNTVFATQGTINTSDERYKKDIKPIKLSTEFIKKLEPITFVWRDTINKYDPDIPGSKDLPPVIHKRNHCGLVAQSVKKSIEECGLTLNDVDIIDNDFLVNPDEPDIYNIRYHSLIPVLIKTIQELEARITALEKK